MKTFTPDQWAKLSRLDLATAILFTEDLVEMGLAVPVDEHRLRLTDRGERLLRHFGELQSLEAAS